MFTDLGNVYDSVSQMIIWRCLDVQGVATGLHQESVLSPFLFIVILDVITCDIKDIVPQCILFTSDNLLIAESRGEVITPWNVGVYHSRLKDCI